MLRAIVFDFDGVIADSEPLHYSAFRDVLAAHDITLTRPDYYARYLGYDDAGAFRAIAADRGVSLPGDRIAALVADKAGRMEDLERTAGVLFPGAADVIRRAAAQVPIAIASGALRAEIVRVLDREGLTAAFAAIVGAEDTPRSKPAPDPYLRAVSLLGASQGALLDPAECVAIEDSIWGLQSARDAGLRTVAVAQTYGTDELRRAADLVIPSLADLDFAALRALWPH